MNILMEKINKTYGDKEVLKDFTAKFQEGTVTFITGESGIGKTSSVRGKPSNRKPFLQSSCAMRSFTMPMMMSSRTKPPSSMIFFASKPSGVPALIAAQVPAPASYGRKPIEPAPGRYVKAKA